MIIRLRPPKPLGGRYGGARGRYGRLFSRLLYACNRINNATTIQFPNFNLIYVSACRVPYQNIMQPFL